MAQLFGPDEAQAKANRERIAGVTALVPPPAPHQGELTQAERLYALRFFAEGLTPLASDAVSWMQEGLDELRDRDEDFR